MTVLRVFLQGERRSAIAWSAGVGGYMLLIGAIFSAFADPEAYTEIYDSYPPEFREVFGEIENIGTVQGFLKVEVGSILPLVLGVFAVMTTTRHLAGAEETGRLDHLLSRPIDRGQYYWNALGSSGVVLVVLLIGGAVGGILGFTMAGANARELLGLIGFMIEFIPFAAVYLALGAMLGAIFHRRALATGLGILVLFGLYIMDIAATLVEEIEWLSYVTPHGYYADSDLFNGALDAGYLLFCVVVAAVLAWIGYEVFERKDLYA